MGSKGKAKVISNYSFLLPFLPYLPLILHPPVVIFLWALSHYPSSAFHSPITLSSYQNNLNNLQTDSLLWFLSIPVHQSPFSQTHLSATQIFRKPVSSSKCLLIPYYPSNSVQKSESDPPKYNHFWSLIFECKISHTYDYIQPLTQMKFEKKDFSHQWNK